jgi:UDP-3-O-[3-hydroxymyristoyl] glucosamine N-acyltransferase
MKLGDLAARIECRVEGDPGLEIERLAPIEEAGPGELTFVANPRYRSKLAGLQAAAVILGEGVEAPGLTVLRARDPYLAFVRALEVFHRPYHPDPGVHPTAAVAPSARIGARAAIGAYVVVGEQATIGDDARLDPHVVIYPRVTIGDRFVAHAGVVVREDVQIGHDVKLQAGAVVGGDGFGYLPDEKGGVRPIPQSGTVVLEDGVEIGANTTVDRAAVGATRIRRGAKVDNLVMIGHGSDVGESSFLASQVGLSGSTKIGRYVQVGGQVGFAGHLTVGDGARIGAKSGVPNDVPAGATIGGYPAVDIKAWARIVAVWKRLPELAQRLRRLEQHVGIKSKD